MARALDREKLAEAVLKPLGLPAEPVGSHLALSGQPAYADGSGALGEQDAKEARALLADAGWVPGGPVKKSEDGEKAAGAEKSEDDEDGKKSDGGDEGTYIVGEEGKSGEDGKDGEDGKGTDGKNKDDGEGGREEGEDTGGTDQESGEKHSSGKNTAQGGAPGAYAPKGTAAPAGAAAGPVAKDGKALTLRFVLPSGPGSQALRTVADRISDMLEKIGIGTEITKVPDESYFKDHVASGEYDLALYSWPASAFPATDARPIYAKPVPAADGSLNVAQNYTRVGTDQVDQLFDQAMGTLDEGKAGTCCARPTPGSGRRPAPSRSTSAPSSWRPARTSPTRAPSASRHRSTRTWAS